MGKASKKKMGQCLGGGLLSLSLSLSLLALVARLCVKFKRLFYSFCRRFCSFHRNFISTYRKFFLFYRSFNSSFCLQKAFFRALCFFEIFKRFIFGLFALIIASRFCENGVAIHKFSVIFTLWIATLALLARNDGAGAIFSQKFNAFYILPPNFRSVFADKFNTRS